MKARLLILIATALFAATALAATVPMELPPEGIADWYKPANKRQVWLHTMFGLRRELQAVEEYTAVGDYPAAVKWAEKFAKHYRAIGEMVPEWRSETDLEALDAMVTAVKGGDGETLHRAAKELKSTCKSCHGQYQAVTAALYRVPNYRDHRITLGGETLPYPKAMDRLSRLVNRVRIASIDGRPDDAMSNAHTLDTRLGELATSCNDCHQEEAPKARILGTGATPLIEALKTGDIKKSGRALGTLAVEICARCHAIHRPQADLRRQLLRMGQ